MTPQRLITWAAAAAFAVCLAPPPSVLAQAQTTKPAQGTRGQPQTKPETKSETKPQTKPEMKTETKAEMKAETGMKATGNTLGSVRITKKVVADGKPLAAGSYTVRMTNDPVPPVVGQSTDSFKWVEFVQNGQVKGREMATVLTPAEAKTIAKKGTPPSGTSKVETLKGNDYLRVWINRGGTNYLIHLSTSA